MEAIKDLISSIYTLCQLDSKGWSYFSICILVLIVVVVLFSPASQQREPIDEFETKEKWSILSIFSLIFFGILILSAFL